MRKFINIFFILLFIFIFIDRAEAASIESISATEIKVWGEYVIRGSGFGSSAKQGQVCWADTCLAESAIKSWSENEIVFVMNTTGMAERGELLVGFYNNCAENNGGECLGDWDYISGPQITVLPFVSKIIIDNEEYEMQEGFAYVLKPNVEMQIKGEYFGSKSGKVKFGDKETEVISWANQRIVLKVPKVKSFTSTFSIENQFGVASNYKIMLNSDYFNDQYFYYQTYLSWLYLPEALKENKAYGDNIIVAVIDSGVNWNHQDILKNIYKNEKEIPNNSLDDDKNGYIDDYYGYNFVTDSGIMPNPNNGHGTMVAGIISAITNNDIGIVGIAPNAEIMPLTVCDDVYCDQNAIAEAIKYATDNGARIINLSLCGLGSFYDYTELFNEAVNYAYEKNVIIVSAAGNGEQLSSESGIYYGRNLNNAPNSPVCNDSNGRQVIGVASIEYGGQKSEYSDYGANCIDVSAFGTKIFSLSHPSYSSIGSEYDIDSGTSFAAPQVSGAAALLLSKRPELTSWEVNEYIRNSGTSIDSQNQLEYQNQLGKLLNIQKLMQYLPTKNDLSKIKFTDAWYDKDYLYIKGDFFAKKMDVTILSNNGQFSSNDFSYTLNNAFSSPTLLKISNKKLHLVDEKGYTLTIKLERYDGGVLQISDFFVKNIKKAKLKISNIFTDVSEFNKNKDAILYLKEKGVINGYPDGSFKPLNAVNRAELLKILIEGAGIKVEKTKYANCFPDVKDEWYAKYVCYAKEQNWIEGYPDGYFRPEQKVNKVEALKMLLNIQKVKLPLAIYVNPFFDVDLKEWYAPYVYRAKELDILEETGNEYIPGGIMTRAGISENLYRLIRGSN